MKNKRRGIHPGAAVSTPYASSGGYAGSVYLSDLHLTVHQQRKQEIPERSKLLVL